MPADYGWQTLFDGSSLEHWRVLDFAPFGESGTVELRGGVANFAAGRPFTGLVIDDPGFAPPAAEYELAVRARRVSGSDFFAAITFPVPSRRSHCTFVAGGWGGWTVGLSDIDGLSANRNTTGAAFQFEIGRWYELRVAVRRDEIRCYIDGAIVAKVSIAGRDVSLKPGGIERCAPLGLASWRTESEVGSVRIRALPPEGGVG